MQYKPHGAMSYLNGISMLDARIGEAFWKAWKKDDDATIQFILQHLEAPFFDGCASKYGWHRTNKALLQAAGFMHRRDRMPLKHLNDEEYQNVESVFLQVNKEITEFFN
jgi:4-hydroxy-tetrahydrodipicolinate synthase